MSRKFFKTHKATLFKIITVLLLVVVAGHYLNVYKRHVYRKLSAIDKKLDFLQMRVLENNFVQTGYLINNFANSEKNLESSIFFIGHIYPKSGYIDSKNARFRNIEHPLRYLILMAKQNSPFKIVFGGDNVQNPTPGALDFLLNLKSKLGNVRFILGNHDQYWMLYEKEPKLKEIYPQRYYFEDEKNVRLIYLHSVLKNGKYGLDEEQIKFLKESLKPSVTYTYALIFLHHNLWLGGHGIHLYSESARVVAQWKNDVIPIISEGRVKGVFFGDGGIDTSGTFNLINGIPHYSTGWSMDRSEIPPEWLRIDLEEEGINVFWQKLSGGNLFVKKQLER